MPTDAAVKPWTLRSTLIAVSDLERSSRSTVNSAPFTSLPRETCGRSR